MTTEKLTALLGYYGDYLFDRGTAYPQELTEEEKRLPFSRVGLLERRRHVHWMCQQAKGFVAEGRIDKAMRWLGFIQGYLATTHVFDFSLENLKQHSRPETVLVAGKWEIPP